MKKDLNEDLIKDHHPEVIRKRLSLEPKRQNISDAVLGGIDGCITTFASSFWFCGRWFSLFCCSHTWLCESYR